MKKIGVFAGVFDPIHLGHTYFIQKTIEEKNLDKLYLLVEKKPRFKDCLASFEQREQMAKLATAEIPSVEIYDCQGESFPISSCLPEIKQANPDAQIYLLMGDDVAAHINEWDNAQELLNGVELVIAARSGEDTYAKTSSLKVRDQIKANVKPMLPAAVIDYIKKNRLY